MYWNIEPLIGPLIESILPTAQKIFQITRTNRWETDFCLIRIGRPSAGGCLHWHSVHAELRGGVRGPLQLLCWTLFVGGKRSRLVHSRVHRNYSLTLSFPPLNGHQANNAAEYRPLSAGVLLIGLLRQIEVLPISVWIPRITGEGLQNWKSEVDAWICCWQLGNEILCNKL